MQLPDNVPPELMQACYKGIADAACEHPEDEIQAIWNTFVQYANALASAPAAPAQDTASPLEIAMTNKDRELLELAARAAGYPPEWKGDIKIGVDAPVYERRWNPLTHDGDALRLAVALRIALTMHEGGCMASNLYLIDTYESYGSDPYAATRRAITRAAAQIGNAKPADAGENTNRKEGST